MTLRRSFKLGARCLLTPAKCTDRFKQTADVQSDDKRSVISLICPDWNSLKLGRKAKVKRLIDGRLEGQILRLRRLFRRSIDDKRHCLGAHRVGIRIARDNFTPVIQILGAPPALWKMRPSPGNSIGINAQIHRTHVDRKP